ncbi:hypothetical protein NL676_014393 [Syzygium grande]|nr:hypothetical protein NL676_014393 [Syzygium grande]
MQGRQAELGIIPIMAPALPTMASASGLTQPVRILQKTDTASDQNQTGLGDHLNLSRSVGSLGRAPESVIDANMLYEEGYPEVLTLGEPSGKYNYYVKYSVPGSSGKVSAQVTPTRWSPGFEHEDQYPPSLAPRRVYTRTLKIPHDPPKEQWFIGREILVVQRPLPGSEQGYMLRTLNRREQRTKKWQELQQQVNALGEQSTRATQD